MTIKEARKRLMERLEEEGAYLRRWQPGERANGHHTAVTTVYDFFEREETPTKPDVEKELLTYLESKQAEYVTMNEVFVGDMEAHDKGYATALRDIQEWFNKRNTQ